MAHLYALLFSAFMMFMFGLILFVIGFVLILLLFMFIGPVRFTILLNGEVKTMAEIVSQSALEHNKDFWFYVVVSFFHGQKSIRRHVHGMEEVIVLVSGLSALAPIRSVSVEEHTPPIGV